MNRKPVVYLALPSRPGENIAMGLMTALWSDRRRSNMGAGFELYDWCAQPMSLLTTNFNTLWCKARNLRFAHLAGMDACRRAVRRDANPFAGKPFADAWVEGWNDAAGEPSIGPITDWAMVHSDVIPEPGRWLQDAIEERRRVGADILQVVLPLKDDAGLTSTGIMRWDSREIAKLSMHEVMELPETFCAADAGADCLLMNTGLWVCDFTQPWVRKMCFRIYDTILEHADGTCEATAVGEDWLFAMDAYRLGLKVYATRKIKATHQGIFRYPNFVDWGTREGEGEWGLPWCIEPPFKWQLETPTACAPPGGCASSRSQAMSMAG